MRSCLSEFVDRKLPVIPVLLPGALEVPLPLFLKRFTWVDLRGGLTEEGINQLQWGATGKRPDRSKLLSIPATPSEANVAEAKAHPASAEVIPAPFEVVTPAVVAKERLGQQVRTPWGLLTWIGLLTLLGVAVFFIGHYLPTPAEPRTQWAPATVSAVRVGEIGDPDRGVVENFIPPWISWLIFALTPFAILINSRKMISSPFARLALGIAVTASAVIVASTGPLAQSVTEITMLFGTPSWLFRPLSLLNWKSGLSLVGALLRWGMLPGAAIALAAASVRGWIKKMIWSGVVGSAAFITLDLLQYYYVGYPQIRLDVGYLVNINVIGGLLSGAVIGSFALFSEQLIQHGAVRPLARQMFTSLMGTLVVAYLGWFFFLDHPSVPVSLHLDRWSSLIVSKPGDSLGPPGLGDGFLFKAQDTWASLSASRKSPVMIEPMRPKARDSGLIIRVAPSPLEHVSFSQSKILKKVFGGAGQRMLVAGAGSIFVRGRGCEFAFAAEEAYVLIAPSTFDFVKIATKWPSPICNISVLERPVGRANARIATSGEVKAYIRSGLGTPLFEIMKEKDGHRGVLYEDEAKGTLVQVSDKSRFMRIEATDDFLVLPNCGALVESLNDVDFLSAEAGPGSLRVGIDQHEIQKGDFFYLANGALKSSTEDGELWFRGVAKEVVLNGVRLNVSRWSRISFQIRAVLIGSLITSLIAAVGLIRKKIIGPPIA